MGMELIGPDVKDGVDMQQSLRWSWIFGVIVLACGEKETTNPLVLDVDGDGYRSDVDCDDENADVFPNALEVCDGIDNDCDALVDEQDDSLEATAWYLDGDGDGFGMGEPTYACEQAEGFVDNVLDCDDANDQISPNAEETCDSIDNDCNSLVDDLSADFNDPFFAVYLDNDGDGFGEESTLFYACETGVGVVDLALDCDDMDASVYPDAVEECDGIDNDCDALVDEQDEGVAQCDECSDEVLPSGAVELEQSLLSGDDVSTSCGQPNSADRVYRWVAPRTGTYVFWSGVETIAIWEDCGATELACGISGIAPANATVDVVEGQTLQIVLEGTEGSMAGLEIWSLEELVCDDGVDDDQDGLMDCDDESDCWFDSACAASQCPNFGLVDIQDYVTPLNGDSLVTMSLSAFSDVNDASCFTTGASDVTFSYTAVSNGCAQIYVTSDQVDVELAIYESCAGAELACSGNTILATDRYLSTYGAYLPLQLSTGTEYILALSGEQLSGSEVTLHIDRNDAVDCDGQILD